ncbi:MAG: pentapeptide repeat-containing protein [Neisseriaceae bacterium]
MRKTVGKLDLVGNHLLSNKDQNKIVSFCSIINVHKNNNILKAKIINLFTYLKFYLGKQTNKVYIPNIHSIITNRINSKGVLRALSRLDIKFTMEHAEFIFNIFKKNYKYTINQILKNIGLEGKIIDLNIKFENNVVCLFDDKIEPDYESINSENKFSNPIPDIYHQIFVDCVDGNLSELSLIRTSWFGVDFTNCNLSRACFIHSNFKKCNFKETTFVFCDFNFSFIQDCTFESCGLGVCDFSHCNLSNSVFKSVELNIFGFSNSDLSTLRVHLNSTKFSCDNVYHYRKNVRPFSSELLCTISTINDEDVKIYFIKYFFIYLFEKDKFIEKADISHSIKLFSIYILNIYNRIPDVFNDYLSNLMSNLYNVTANKAKLNLESVTLLLGYLEPNYLECGMYELYFRNKDIFLEIIKQPSESFDSYRTITRFIVTHNVFHQAILILCVANQYDSNLFIFLPELAKEIVNKLVLLSLTSPNLEVPN